MKRVWGILFLVLACVTVSLCALGFLSACAGQKHEVPIYSNLNELEGKRIGMIAGSLYGDLLIEEVPGISRDDIKTYENLDDLIVALRANEIDAFLSGGAPGEAVASSNDEFALMYETIADDNIGMCLQKNSELTTLINGRLDVLRMDGTMDSLRSKWLETPDAVRNMPEQGKSYPNGTLRVACSTVEPMAYVSTDGSIVGYEAELIQKVANDLGYRVMFYNVPFKSLMDNVASGKADVGIGNITITEERSKRLDYTVPDYVGNVVVVTHASEQSASFNVLASVARSFRKNFVDENRWLVIVNGLVVTATISACTAIFGTPLAFFLARRRYNGNRLVSRIIDVFLGLMGGVPIVVILMVLYYVVFGSINISGEMIAVIAFVLSFGGRASAVIWSDVNNVSTDQRESGLALGYTPRLLYSKIILSLAADSFVPKVIGLYLSVVKETAVVGYIAVQDLTRASDYIRARTMDAFFPLIGTALIYFLICRLLGWVLSKAAARYIEHTRTRSMKGVTQ